MVKKAATEVNTSRHCCQSGSIFSQNGLLQGTHQLLQWHVFGRNFLFWWGHLIDAAVERNTLWHLKWILCFLKSLSCLCSRTCPWSSFLFTNPTSTTCSSLWSSSVTTSKLRTSLLETISASPFSGRTSPKPRRRSPGAWLGLMC